MLKLVGCFHAMILVAGPMFMKQKKMMFVQKDFQYYVLTISVRSERSGNINISGFSRIF